MTRHIGKGVAVGLLVLGFAGAAFADIPPPPDYVERCTVEQVKTDATECQACGAWHGDRDVCKNTLGKEGYTESCRTRGASAWTEVWCRPKGDAKPAPDAAPAPIPAVDGAFAPPPPAEKKVEAPTNAPKADAPKASCSLSGNAMGCSAGASGGTPALFGLTLLSLLALRRRRR